MSKGIVQLALGIAIGAAGSWFVAKRRFERIADEEIASVKKAFSKKDEPEAIEEKPVKEEAVVSTIEEGKDTANKTAYNKAAQEYAKTPKYPKPYVIKPEEFGDSEFNLTLSYYEDGVVVDESGVVMNDVEDAIGSDFENEFGHYEEDTVYIRNEARKCDYEIIREGEVYEHTKKG